MTFAGSTANNDQRTWDRFHHQNISLQRRRSLCMLTLEYCSLPVIDEDHYIFGAEIYEYQIWEWGTLVTRTTTGIDCRTYPSVYLLLEDDPVGRADERLVMVFMDATGYSFIQEMVTKIGKLFRGLSFTFTVQFRLLS